MRLSAKIIKELQKLLKEQAGKDYADEGAGIAIIRLVVAKEKRLNGL